MRKIHTSAVLALAGTALIAMPILTHAQPGQFPRNPPPTDPDRPGTPPPPTQPPPPEAPPLQPPPEPVQPPQTPEPPLDPAPIPAAEEIDQPEVQVRLIEPGEEPRRELRYEILATASQETTITMEMSSRITREGQEIAAPDVPPLAMRMHFDVAEGANGMFIIEGELREIRLETDEVAENGEQVDIDPMVHMMNQALRELQGVTMVSRIDDRGITEETQVEVPPGINPELANLARELEQPITNIGIHLPEEEIGEGARWEVVTTRDQQGIDVTQTIVYELVSLNGERANLRMTLSQTAEPQQTEQGRLRSLQSTGTGTATIDFQRAAAIRSQSEIESRIELTIMENGQELDVLQEVTMKSRLESSDRQEEPDQREPIEREPVQQEPTDPDPGQVEPGR